jgi:MFS family permease
MGRKPIYLISMSIYISANILLASLPENVVALFILRTAQAIGGASGISLGAGVVVDIIEPKRRGAVLATTSLGVLVGPVLGPLIGGLLAQSNWRWTFGFLGMIDACFDQRRENPI